MSDRTAIEWTDATWNPTRGCSRVSEGCRHCYAERMAGRFSGPGMWGRGVVNETPEGPRWNGNVYLVPDKLGQPLSWRTPRRVFVNSTSDLFHERLDNEAIAAVFGVMAACPQHTFQVLTKRPERMRAWFRWVARTEVLELSPSVEAWGRIGLAAARAGAFAPKRGRDTSNPPTLHTWPLPNVWLGVSVEDQATADARIPLLLDTPAAVRFISAEPLLGPVDLTTLRYDTPGHVLLSTMASKARPAIDALRGYLDNGRHTALDWVIVGGESGPGARPMQRDWARDLRDQCEAAGVPFFFKQWGEWAPLWDPYIEDLRNHPVVRLGGETVCRYGKHAAGRLLDGREHNEMPAEVVEGGQP